jgi:uncharacterized damage-inducible protein DinB
MDKTMQLLQYNLWANDKVFTNLKNFPADLYRREVVSVFPSISAVLIHMYQVDHVWLEVLKGVEFEDIVASVGPLYEEIKAASLEEMEKKFTGIGMQYESFILEKKDLSLETTIHHPHFGMLETNYADLIQHIVNHGTYHRGHISAILNQLGNKGASTDYIFYLYTLQQQKQKR